MTAAVTASITSNINTSPSVMMNCSTYYEVEGCAKHDRDQFNAWRAVCSKDSTQWLCNNVDPPEDIFQGCAYVFFFIITLDLLTAFILMANRFACPKGYCTRMIGTNCCFLCCRMLLGYRSGNWDDRYKEAQKKKYIKIVTLHNFLV